MIKKIATVQLLVADRGRCAAPYTSKGCQPALILPNWWLDVSCDLMLVPPTVAEPKARRRDGAAAQVVAAVAASPSWGRAAAALREVPAEEYESWRVESWYVLIVLL